MKKTIKTELVDLGTAAVAARLQSGKPRAVAQAHGQVAKARQMGGEPKSRG